MRSGSWRRATARGRRAKGSSPGRPCAPGKCRDRRHAGRASTVPQPEAPVPACRDACRCGPPRSTPVPRSASGSSFAQNTQNPPKRFGVHLAVDRHASPGAKLDFDHPGFRSSAACCCARLSCRLGPRGASPLRSQPGQNRTVSPARFRSSRLPSPCKRRLCATPCRRATSHTTAPGISVSSTIRAFSSLFQRRRVRPQ